MNTLEVHEMLAEAYAADPEALAGWLPEDCELVSPIPGADVSVAALTAAVALSGMQEDAQTLADLREACEHFKSLLAAGVYDYQQWNEQASAVILEIVRWGDQVTAHERN